MPAQTLSKAQRPFSAAVRRLVAHKDFPILVLLLVNLAVGTLIARDYGESWDEHLRYRYGAKSLTAYQGERPFLQDEKGAFYVMMAKVGSDLLGKITPGWQSMERWHLMHFLSFLMGIYFLYKICLGLMSRWAVLGAALVFNTQPLLWGHAFINPKDIPFMSFFLGSVALGWQMVEFDTASLPNPIADKSTGNRSLARMAAIEWQQSDKIRQLVFAVLTTLSLAPLLVVILSGDAIRKWLADLITQAYFSPPSSLLGAFFAQIAEQRAKYPVEVYVEKSAALYPSLIAACLALALFALLLVTRLYFPNTWKATWLEHGKPFLSKAARSLGNRSVLGAGIFLGLCTSIRTVGPAAGLLVAAYFLLTARRRAWPVLLAYGAIAVLTTYLTWPALWDSPVKNFFNSLSLASDFPWEGKILFAGVDYPVTNLPRSYLPVLFSIQITETALLLFLLGAVAASLYAKGDRINRPKIALVAVWLLVPLALVVIFQPTLYDNFRQLLFITPPIFILSGIGLQFIFDRTTSTTASIAIISVLILPNLIWMGRLHPYQYIYYNTLVGGVNGAFRNYESDYWATSYREATAFLNANAPANALVVVWGPDHIVRGYARDDLVIQEYRKMDREDASPHQYAILSTRHNKDLSLFPEAPIIFEATRDGAKLAVIKQIDSTP